MSRSAPSVVAIGNALVDVLAHEPDEFLAEHHLVKGTMTLVDLDAAERLYAAMGPAVEVSGGCGANTVAGIASLGGHAAYIGRVRDDTLGRVYVHDLRAAGVRFDTPPARDGMPTGRCLVVVTPDAERTMSTYLGASVELDAAAVDRELVAAAAVTYLEGYLWDVAGARAAFRTAVRVAQDAGRRVALTLSDRLVVDRHRDTFLELIEHGVDILFANEAEICSLYEVDKFDEALQHVGHHCEIAALTRSEKGSVVVTADEVHVVDAHPVPDGRVVDTTGAGDLYAAGFLYGLTEGAGLATCARLGSLAAAEVISHLGARPEVRLADLARPLLDARS